MKKDRILPRKETPLKRTRRSTESECDRIKSEDTSIQHQKYYTKKLLKDVID